MARVVPVLIVILLSLAPRVDAEPPARLLDIGWTVEAAAVKVVAHFDRPVRLRTGLYNGLLTVDLWPVGDAQTRTLVVNTGNVASVRQQHLAPGVVRLSVDLRGTVRYKIFIRPNPYKVAVVLVPVWRAMTPMPSSVAYRVVRVPTGEGLRVSTRVHVLTVDLADPRIELRPVLATGVVPGHEPAAATATRLDAIAAINGGFFTLSTGQPLGLIVIDGKLLSTPLLRRSVFAITGKGTPVIQAFAFRGRVQGNGGPVIPVSAVNRPPRWGGVAVYTPEYGPLTPDHPLHAVVRAGSVAGFASGRVPIPSDGYVLSATTFQRDLLLARLQRNQRVTLDLSFAGVPIQHAISGGPRLVRNGEVFVPYQWEWFRASFARRRTSRSAVGITPGGKILLVTVEGRNLGNSGMNLFELARLLRDLGAVEAMNLDGGGSSTLVVGGQVVNRPERAQRGVATMLAIVRRQGAGVRGPLSLPR